MLEFCPIKGPPPELRYLHGASPLPQSPTTLLLGEVSSLGRRAISPGAKNDIARIIELVIKKDELPPSMSAKNPKEDINYAYFNGSSPVPSEPIIQSAINLAFNAATKRSRLQNPEGVLRIIQELLRSNPAPLGDKLRASGWYLTEDPITGRRLTTTQSRLRPSDTAIGPQ